MPLKFQNDEERIFWKHAAIAGDATLADQLVEELRERMPEKGYDPDPEIVGGYQKSSLVKFVRSALALSPSPSRRASEIYAGAALRDATGWHLKDADAFVQDFLSGCAPVPR
jgi:hypothetical protein